MSQKGGKRSGKNEGCCWRFVAALGNREERGRGKGKGGANQKRDGLLYIRVLN